MNINMITSSTLTVLLVVSTAGLYQPVDTDCEKTHRGELGAGHRVRGDGSCNGCYTRGLDDCKKKCDANPDCAAWNLQTMTNRCWFKKEGFTTDTYNHDEWVWGHSCNNERDTYVIDVKAKYNVSYEGINQALDEAREMFALGPANREVVIHITSGIYHINFPDRKATINITRAKPQPQGRLVFEGAGPDKTILLASHKNRILRGTDVYHLTVRNIQFKRETPMVSQGTVVNVGKEFVDLHIEQNPQGNRCVP